MKPGYKTTEFWMSLVTQIVALLVLFGVIEPAAQEQVSGSLTQLVAAIAAVFNAAGYAFSRGLAKKNG